MLTDEVDQKENSGESESGDRNLSEVEEPGEDVVSHAKVAELEDLVAQKDEELARAKARITQLEQELAGREEDIATLRQSQAELEERLSTVSDSLDEAVASYKAMVIRANPEIVEELINGDTIEAINESLEKAKSLIGKVRQGLEAEISLARVPAGAPERRAPDVSALTPREKIQYAIGGRK